MKLNIFVPVEGSNAAAVIAPGSGVVGEAGTGERIACHFEGNLIGADNLRAFLERLHSAAGRLVSKYPTIAVGVFDVAELDCVGEYDAELGIVSQVHDALALVAWAGEPIEAIVGTPLPDGPIDWNVAAKASVDARSLGNHSFMTKAGQVIEFDVRSGNAKVRAARPDLPDAQRPEDASGPEL